MYYFQLSSHIFWNVSFYYTTVCVIFILCLIKDLTEIDEYI